ncbi:hypothetical protein WAB17_11855 [Parerythrobacter aurantius]|uniref:hypothetical protein n=1 Tax=Parerythrobacter aurantius TaxID=3127706 RepID=UPI0032508EE8
MRFINLSSARPGASLAMAAALLCGTALGAVALEAPAAAQKEEKQAKPKFSKNFEKAYAPVVPLINAPTPDEAAIRAALPAMLAAASTEDDKNTAGNILLNAGGKFDDYAMQIQGLEMMIASGKNNDRLGQLRYAGFQVYSNAGDMAKAREWLIQASDLGYSFEGKLTDGTSKTVTAGDLRVMAAETYFDDDQYEAGLADLLGWLRARDAAGQPIEESWVRKGFATAFNNQMGPQAADFGALFLKYYPSANVWADAITVQNGFFNYDAQETLDLMRLARRAGVLNPTRIDAMQTDEDRKQAIRASLERMYLDYAEAADFRRLPGEVKAVLDEGIATGVLQANDVTVADWLGGANGRISQDKADLPALERDARSGSTLSTVLAAGDAFLSYGDAAKAEEFYTKALTLPGADAARIQTRLGIAQVDQGKYDAAVATFAKVEGNRKPIANLWSTFAAQKAAGK